MQPISFINVAFIYDNLSIQWIFLKVTNKAFGFSQLPTFRKLNNCEADCLAQITHTLCVFYCLAAILENEVL